MTHLRKYDAVVLPISFSEEQKNMSVFNIATKFSECLSSGIPSLIIGPADAVMVEMADSQGAALVVDQQCSEAARTALGTLRNREHRAAIVEAALKLCREEFSESVMHSRWEPAREFLFGHEKSKSS